MECESTDCVVEGVRTKTPLAHLALCAFAEPGFSLTDKSIDRPVPKVLEAVVTEYFTGTQNSQF